MKLWQNAFVLNVVGVCNRDAREEHVQVGHGGLRSICMADDRETYIMKPELNISCSTFYKSQKNIIASLLSKPPTKQYVHGYHRALSQLPFSSASPIRGTMYLAHKCREIET